MADTQDKGLELEENVEANVLPAGAEQRQGDAPPAGPEQVEVMTVTIPEGVEVHAGSAENREVSPLDKETKVTLPIAEAFTLIQRGYARPS